MNKTYYDAKYRISEDGRDLSNEVETYFTSLFTREMKKGFSPREIAHILVNVIGVTESGMVLLPEREKDIRPSISDAASRVNDVHTQHCCTICGCKYGYDTLYDENRCSVTNGSKLQNNLCENCFPDY